MSDDLLTTGTHKAQSLPEPLGHSQSLSLTLSPAVPVTGRLHAEPRGAARTVSLEAGGVPADGSRSWRSPARSNTESEAVCCTRVAAVADGPRLIIRQRPVRAAAAGRPL